MKYEVIATAAHWAVTDFGLSMTAARRHLRPAKFDNGVPALRWPWGFRTRRDAEYFRERCSIALAVASGRLGRWIPPTFTVRRIP